MRKLLFILIPIQLTLILLMGEINKSWGNNSNSTSDTLPKKKDSSATQTPGNSSISASDTIHHKKDSVIAVKTCLSCHGGLVEKKIKHTTTTNKGCEDCHKISGMPMEHQKGTIVLQNTLPNLCLSCHDKTKVTIANSTNVHSVVNDKKSCTNCHSPHSSDEKILLVDKKKELCLSCHSNTITTKTKTVANIGQLEKNAKSIHPPFKKCSASCHNPHASSNYKMLNTFFTPDTYVATSPDSFALCWECHDPELMTAAKTSTATSFRNGDKNLHYVHVHGEKGRSCMMCHSPHASSNEHLIREKVGFGNWEFKMNYKSDENGGSCAPGCHVERKYNR